MSITTPQDKFKPRVNAEEQRGHIYFWRTYPNGELYPVVPFDSAELFSYRIATPGFGASTISYYKRKGFRPLFFIFCGMRNPSIDEMRRAKASDNEMEALSSLAMEIRFNAAEYDRLLESYQPEAVGVPAIESDRAIEFRVQAEKLAKQAKRKADEAVAAQ